MTEMGPLERAVWNELEATGLNSDIGIRRMADPRSEQSPTDREILIDLFATSNVHSRLLVELARVIDVLTGQAPTPPSGRELGADDVPRDDDMAE